jgi:radical SAM protein with 4Fe4S-binding SPASM domain
MDLSWIDQFIANIRPYVHVRETDRIFIKKPNTAYKLNASGVELLEFLLNRGGSVKDILRAHEHGDDVSKDLNQFFLDIKRLLEGEMCEFYQSPAIERIPFELGYNSLPVLSEVAVTYRCNLSCRFCYAGCGQGCSRRDSSEMSLPEIKRILEIIYKEAQAPTVSFTGGEPLLRSDLPGMVAYAKSLGFRVNLITNGTLATMDRVKALVDAGLDSAQVSIEGSGPHVHDRITGLPGSFEQSVAGLERISASGITVHHHTTMNRLNWDDLDQMPHLAAGLGMDRFSMNMVIPTGAAEDHREILVRYSELEEKLLSVKARATTEGVRFLWYSPTPLCIFNPITHDLGNKGCAACDGLISVAPDGSLLPCSSYDEPIGNLLEESFGNIWESRKARLFRYKRHAPPRCRSCDRLAICNGGCPLYWRAMGYGELCQKEDLGKNTGEKPFP